MRPRSLLFSVLSLTYACFGGQVAADDPALAAGELEGAIHLEPDLENGRKVYLLCAVCHQPEGWGSRDGDYPQIAGQHSSVMIKQLADIRARNRDNPTMFPFTLLDHLTLQQIADVSAYIARFPMNPDNGVGPGDDLEHGEGIYAKNCVECHGDRGEGIAGDQMPLIQGQHYQYLVRQFEWIRDGKRRNADPEMIEQIKSFTSRDVSAVMDYTSRLRPPAERLAQPDYRNPDFPHFWRPQIPASASYDE
ncbi:MAG: c-type cytochrome [Pseudomonadota bacterium]|nr:c-type cytochrome [Pseudomonadota bacterium]